MESERLLKWWGGLSKQQQDDAKALARQPAPSMPKGFKKTLRSAGVIESSLRRRERNVPPVVIDFVKMRH